MTLNEKFEKATDGWIVADRCEEVANEFAVGFAEWCVKYRDKNRNVNGEMLHAKSKYDESYTTKDLLEIYKKTL